MFLTQPPYSLAHQRVLSEGCAWTTPTLSQPHDVAQRPVTAARCWLRSVYFGDNALRVNWLMTTNSCIDGIGVHCNSCVVVETAVQPPDRPNDPATNPTSPNKPQEICRATPDLDLLPFDR